jgi:peptide/nickel transport system substrate-binding protein
VVFFDVEAPQRGGKIKMRSKFTLFASLVVILSLLLIACSAPATPAPAATAEQPAQPTAAPAQPEKAAEPTQAPAPTAAPEPTQAPAAAAELVYGNLPRNETFIVGHQVPSSDIWDAYNPFPASANNASGFFEVMLELPFYLDDVGELHPFLAKSWEYSEDGKTFTLTIEDKANWNDGKPLTIDDWLFTVDYLAKNADKVAAGITFRDDVASVQADGADKLVFNLNASNFRFHRNFVNAFYVLPKHVWEGQDPVEFKNPEAVGSGPYKLVSANPETRVVIWERRADYWDAARMPAPKYMVWTQAPKQDLSTFEWEQGNFDLGSLENAPVKAAMQQNPAIKQYLGLDPCPRRAYLNHTAKPLDDPAFRHAISLLIDRQRAANLGDPPAYPNVVPWPYDPTRGDPVDTYYDPADIVKYDIQVFDPAKAAQILDEAGYKLVDGKRLDKEGNPIQLTVQTFQPQYTHWKAWADILSEEAAKVGIQIDVKVEEASTFIANWLNGTAQISFGWNCPAADDPYGAYVDLMPENFKPLGESSANNPGRYEAPQALVDVVRKIQAGNPADPETQKLYKEAFALTFGDYVWAPLFGDYFIIPYSTEYWQGFEKANILVYWGPMFRQILTQITPAQ